MGTIAGSAGAARPATGRDGQFFLVSAILMALVLVAGFSLNLAMGRSTFASPPRFHAHALLFFGWTALYVTQNALAANNSLALHRRLGWLAAIWVPLMVVSGIYMTVLDVRAGRLPPFFQPAYFLAMNPLQILGFAALVLAAILQRRRTQWHRRLMLCAMATILGPGFGRLLPMPLFIPWTGWAAFAPGLLFPVAGAIRDLRRDGRVHPAWWWGIGAMLAVQTLVGLLAASPAGLAAYEWVTSGLPHPLPPYDFPIFSHR
ncbi:MAG: hypothetical protein QM761_13225 [Pseudoxanthomonas sp.]